MAAKVLLFLVFVSCLLHFNVAVNPLEQFPPVSAPPSDSSSPSPEPESPISSPPSPSQDLAPGSAPPLADSAPVPGPSPMEANGINHAETSSDKGESSGGMSARKKAGIAVLVIVAMAAVIGAGMLYKKRQENIRRSQYMLNARRNIL